jgi:hypothetical protein
VNAAAVAGAGAGAVRGGRGSVCEAAGLRRASGEGRAVVLFVAIRRGPGCAQ